MGKFSEQLKNKFKTKNMEKKQKENNEKYFNQVYRPDVEIKLTGEQFMILQRAVNEIRKDRFISVQVPVEGKTYRGFGLSERDLDIEYLYGYIEDLHKKNVDSGVTVNLDVLKKEFEEAEKKTKEVESIPQPQVEEKEMVAPKEEENQGKKIVFK